MMNISPIVNSVKCTVLACFVQFWLVLPPVVVEGRLALRTCVPPVQYCSYYGCLSIKFIP